MRARSFGFSMIEMMLVLTIIAALAVAVFITYPKVQSGRTAAFETQNLNTFQAAMKGLFTTGDYHTLTTQMSAQANMWPSSMATGGAGGTTVTNRWLGNVTVYPSDPAGGLTAAVPASYFTVVYPSVPSDVCQKLTPGLISNWGRVVVGTTVIVDQISAAPQAYDPTLVAPSCGTPGGAGVTITLTSN